MWFHKKCKEIAKGKNWFVAPHTQETNKNSMNVGFTAENFFMEICGECLAILASENACLACHGCNRRT
jgi:hypothetical protein